MPDIDDLEARLNELEREIGNVKSGSLSGRFEDIEEDLGSQIDDLDSRLSDIEDKIRSIERGL